MSFGFAVLGFFTQLANGSDRHRERARSQRPFRRLRRICSTRAPSATLYVACSAVAHAHTKVRAREQFTLRPRDIPYRSRRAVPQRSGARMRDGGNRYWQHVHGGIQGQAQRPGLEARARPNPPTDSPPAQQATESHSLMAHLAFTHSSCTSARGCSDWSRAHVWQPDNWFPQGIDPGVATACKR